MKAGCSGYSSDRENLTDGQSERGHLGNIISIQPKICLGEPGYWGAQVFVLAGGYTATGNLRWSSKTAQDGDSEGTVKHKSQRLGSPAPPGMTRKRS